MALTTQCRLSASEARMAASGIGWRALQSNTRQWLDKTFNWPNDLYTVQP